MKIDIGIDPGQREQIAGGLSRVLADTYTLYLKTHNFHWNVTRPMFQIARWSPGTVARTAREVFKAAGDQ
jgi:hypothetical protein